MSYPIGGSLPASMRHVEKQIANLPRRSVRVLRAKVGKRRETSAYLSSVKDSIVKRGVGLRLCASQIGQLC